MTTLVESTATQISRSTPLDELPERLTIEEFAAAAGLCRASAYDFARRGLVPVIRLGRRIFVLKSALVGVRG